MAGLFQKGTGIYTVQFYDATRSPQRKRVSTETRVARAAERLRRHWEAEVAEGRYDPWTDPPPVPGGPARPRAVVTLAEARGQFLASRSHRAANTVANYERVTGWLADAVGGETPVARVGAADVQQWVESLDVKSVTKANYVRHLRAFFRYCISEGLSTTEPAEGVRLGRVPRQFPKALRPEEVERVAVYAEAHCRDGEERSDVSMTMRYCSVAQDVYGAAIRRALDPG